MSKLVNTATTALDTLTDCIWRIEFNNNKKIVI